jgi:hypothetical protein
MFNRFLARTVMASMVAVVGLALGCEERPPSDPTPLPAPTTLSVSAISPTAGSTVRPTVVTITGTGFLAGATVTLDAAATGVIVVSGTMITATAPARDAGTVDVVVTNPNGQTGRLTGAFTYVIPYYTLTPSTNTVAAGGQLGVSWTAQSGGAADWIGLFKVGDPNTSYDYWWEYTNGATSGTLPVRAPTVPGQYEFRYLLDDGFVDTVRSSAVTVTSG